LVPAKVGFASPGEKKEVGLEFKIRGFLKTETEQPVKKMINTGVWPQQRWSGYGEKDH